MIELPEWVSPSEVTPRLIDYGRWNKPLLGGRHTRTDRPGNRFGVEVTLPPVRNDVQADELLACLVKAKTEGMRFRWETGRRGGTAFGGLTVAAQSQGSRLALTGAFDGAALNKGRFFSLERGGEHYLHMVDEHTVADASGNATLGVTPNLRVIAEAGDALEFGTPFIDGVVEGEEWSWKVRLEGFLDLTFSLVER